MYKKGNLILKIAIFIPNLSRELAGGAETYLLGIASVLAPKHDITIYTLANFRRNFNMDSIYKKYGFGLFKTKYIFYISVGKKHPYIKIISELLMCGIVSAIDKKYDMFINGSQNRIIGPRHIKSMHIIHFPEEPAQRVIDCALTRWIDRKYIDSYNEFVANSQFTAKWFEKYWGHSCSVLNPIINMVPIDEAELELKENIILAVDRIVPDKKIQEMVCAFKELYNIGIKNYKFIIVGNKNAKFDGYLNDLLEAIENYPIEIKSGIPYSELVELYRKAQIFWHAKGLGVDENNPFEMEHFGMTTVEAMANGCVPIVINKAGQIEIIEDTSQGYKWDTLEELVEYTLQIINNPELLKKIQKSAINRSIYYLYDSFAERLTEMIESM